MKIFLLIFIFCSVRAQQSFELQFLGDSLSQEEAKERKLCETKYCLLDAQYLFSGATQNKSVRPCDDFKEFALGTFLKYQSVNDRNPFAGFSWDFQLNNIKKARKVVSAPVNENDSRISKGIKTFFAKCVNSRYIRKNGVSEAREYMQSLGLKFYPETNDKDFNLKNYIEQEGTNSFRLLFHRHVDYSDDSDPSLNLRIFKHQYFDLQLESYETMLYEMNQIFRNSSHSEEFKKEFKEIANRQIEFYHRLENVISSAKKEIFPKLMTIDELNNLTSPLNLNWLTIINNQLITKINSSARFNVASPQIISKIAEFLAENEKDAIADYLVYDMLYELINTFLVYVTDKFRLATLGATRANERWQECSDMIQYRMTPAFDALFLKRYFDKQAEDSLRKLAHETIDFALKKIDQVDEHGVFEDFVEKLKSVKFIFGYSEELVGAGELEKLYGDLDFDQNFIKTYHQILALYQKFRREPKGPKIRELLELTQENIYTFHYLLNDNIIFIESAYLDYPFYHAQRPRFFNTATVSTLILEVVFQTLYKYLDDLYDIGKPHFTDHLQYGHEFYESWLESGGEELNLGANRLTNQQLYWIAVAKIHYRKYQTGIEITFDPPIITAKLMNEFHEFISSNPGFNETFNCNISE